MYQPPTGVSELISAFIQSPHDPHLQEQVAACCAAGPEQAVYVESKLMAWLQEGAPIRTAVPPPAIPTKPVRVFNRKWIAAAAAIGLLIAGSGWYLQHKPGKMRQYSNNTGHIDTLLLAKGSSVIAGKQTVLNYAETFEATPQVKVVNGNAYFDIDCPAKISIELDEHTVLKTRKAVFNVYRTNTVFRVFVVKGQVTLTPDQGYKTVLTAGMQAKRELHHPLQKKTLKSQSPLAWKTGRLQFRSIPLEEVLEALNGYYNVEIILPPSAGNLYKRRITADFGHKTAGEMIAMLHQLLDLPIVKDSANRYYVTMK